MARHKVVPDEAILDAARVVFLEQGVAASTQEIARRANVSEALVFKRFKTKEQLFKASMDLAEAPAWVRRLQELQGQGDLKENLAEICALFVETLRKMMPRMMMLWSARRETFEPFCHHAPPVRSLRAMTEFFDAEMGAGRMKRCDPEVVARALQGALTHYVLSELMGINAIMPMPDRTFVRGLVENLWSGVAPQSRPGR